MWGCWGGSSPALLCIEACLLCRVVRRAFLNLGSRVASDIPGSLLTARVGFRAACKSQDLLVNADR